VFTLFSVDDHVVEPPNVWTDRVREAEVSRIAVDILGVQPDDVARALRGNLTEDDEDDASVADASTADRWRSA